MTALRDIETLSTRRENLQLHSVSSTIALSVEKQRSELSQLFMPCCQRTQKLAEDCLSSRYILGSISVR